MRDCLHPSATPSPSVGPEVTRTPDFRQPEATRGRCGRGTYGPGTAVGRVRNVATMLPDTKPVTILSESECWRLLSTVSLGRLVTTADGEPAIFPVNFVVQHRTILFRTAEGTKLAGTAINKQVLFEADGHTLSDGWSVIVKGDARTPHTDDDIHDAEHAGLHPWTATPKPHFVRIRPLRITGRRFAFGPESAF